MGATKTNLFTDQQNRIAALAKAMGHPARIAILMHLLEHQSCICGSIVAVLPLSQSTVSQHLKALKEVGIIKGNIEGTSICYCIDPKVWLELKNMFGHFNDQSCC